MTHPILYQNSDRNVTLIDIPTSIVAAQETPDILLSSEPLQEPYVISVEPKTAKAMANVGQNTVDRDLHCEYKDAIDKALVEIKQHVSGSWCLPRKLMSQLSSKSKEQKTRNVSSAVEMDTEQDSLNAPSWPQTHGAENSEIRLTQLLKLLQGPIRETAQDISKLFSSLNGSDDSAFKGSHSWVMAYRAHTEQSESGQGIIEEPWNPSFHNSGYEHLELSVFDASRQPVESSSGFSFKVPPLSTFFLHDCAHPNSFRVAFHNIADEYGLPRRFDFILLDPPWPNRSAKRKGTYETQSNIPYLQKMILQMDLDTCIQRNGLVGIWVTNKPAVRAAVLGPNGLFQRLNVGLIEEWIWIKTTVKGEPISAMESLWKKPYEVLLLGRAAPNPWVVAERAVKPKRRVIAGVPDLHSRKPCLKELIEPFMPHPIEYSALEIFARHLVAGWSSWSNEVLKFNWEGYWTESG
ncbi:MT-A70-domain-containing protein [Lepidopterella palustris CBS 459.81]|uniref:MT-A70-domain-containing protein n=1 Tax=Lepidopterella palustris CBS 459.81 TaxID=1314670 RepID=A0A8E2JDS2_9PEZI|nr:MT-A70-domain-containing protein [Lepidopterella palustris CBS 459.81]